MPYYIRKGNDIYRDKIDNTHMWSPINGETSRLVVSSFTTRADATNYILDEQLNCDDVMISNNLEYDK